MAKKKLPKSKALTREQELQRIEDLHGKEFADRLRAMDNNRENRTSQEGAADYRRNGKGLQNNHKSH